MITIMQLVYANTFVRVYYFYMNDQCQGVQYYVKITVFRVHRDLGELVTGTVQRILSGVNTKLK
jgi:hypothetical protein